MSAGTIHNRLHNMVGAPAAVAAYVQVMFRSEDGIMACFGKAAITVLQAEDANTYAPGCQYTLVNGTSTKLYINRGAADAVANFELVFSSDVQSAMTTALTDITHTAPGTPDYAIQDLVQSDTPTAGEGFGFVTKDEGNSVLKIVQANKVHIAEIKAILQALGILA